MCICYDVLRMYVIMYDMIRYVRNTIRCRCRYAECGNTRSVYSNAYSIPTVPTRIGCDNIYEYKM